jgi:heterodisulfide reductase subunit A-like polyferredoxin
MAGTENNKVGAVMVIGAGIAGIQASLDLAESGYYVYLVEKTPAIGGAMSQLDKTFPTNDCSMCILSPKVVECGRHLNIETLTLSDLLDIQGAPGNFTIKIRKRPRYVDMSKCTGCGDCAAACPVEIMNNFDQGLSKKKATSRPYAQAYPSAYAIEKLDRAPCTMTCPAKINVQGYVQLVKIGKYKEAVDLIRENLPLVGVLGRVCPHPCEGECRRAQVDEAVAIRDLKRLAADQIDILSLPIPEIEKREEKVAIVGSGPAGLTAAYFLALMGYQVTIFEALPEPGGMLQVGIPDYRLPKDVLKNEIDSILKLGVTLKTNTALGKDFTIPDLFKQGFKSVYLAIGAHVGKKLGIPGEETPGVVQGTDILREINLKRDVKLGQKLAILGGGNVAIDVARSAIRMGAKEVTIVYRRTREEMPAWEEEIDAALCEGVKIHYLAAPTKVVAKDGKAVGLECLQMELGEPDDSGRRRPVPIKGSEFVLDVDMIIPAIGQETDLKVMEGIQGLSFTRYGTIDVDPLTFATGCPGVFAGGDMHTGPYIAIGAVGEGHEAAVSIDRYLRGEDLAAGRVRDKVLEAKWSTLPLNEEKVPRTHMKKLAPEACCTCFDEVELGYTPEEGTKEADRCLNCGICSECMQCVVACKAEAINHADQEETVQIQVGSVVMAPGFQPFNPSAFDTYQYAQHPNVVTSMEFERILSASGPYQGHLVRPSDHQEPKKVAWLQCVGSRDINHCDHGYCSAVCCMYAIKEAVIAKEHAPQGLDTTIFFMDMRTYGKDFEKYYNRAQEERGVRFVRSRVHSVDPVPETNNLIIQYATEQGEVKQEEFDMVVLSVGLETSAGAIEMAKTMEVPLDANKFAQVSSFSPVNTQKEGVYACGAFDGPKDIPQAVMEASAAACAASQSLASARNSLIKVKEYPAEVEVAGQEPRIGVFVCNCGINIGGIVNVPGVAEYAKTLPHVVHVDQNLFTCSQDSQDKMKDLIREKNINRVVVASCSPRTHEPMFQETLQEVGINKYLFDMANIRDQNSWVHQQEPEKATDKAKDLVRMAVARVGYLEPLKKTAFPLKKSGVVIGGGVAGLTAALNLAEQGYPVHLVEKTDTLGGNALRLRHTWKGEDIGAYVLDLIERVKANTMIQIHFNTEVSHASGFVGNFTTTLIQGTQTQDIEHGMVVLATGAQEWKPDVYGYGQDPRIMTALELDQAITAGDEKVTKAQTAVFVQCVGSREPERPYCSKVCCTHSVESALTLKKLNPEMDIFILYRDIRTFGIREDLYREARNQGVFFVRFDPENKPTVAVDGDKVLVTVTDHVLGQPITIGADVVTLASAIIPNPVKELAESYKIPLNSEGFLLEAHMKLRPVDFATEGIYLCGLAHYPKPIDESIAQAQAAVGRAMTLLAKDTIKVGGIVAVVKEELCAVCLTCVRACPFNVPVIGDRGAAEIDVTKCQGCGVCVSDCPGKAISLQHFTDKQVLAKVHALLAA